MKNFPVLVVRLQWKLFHTESSSFGNVSVKVSGLTADFKMYRESFRIFFQELFIFVL